MSATRAVSPILLLGTIAVGAFFILAGAGKVLDPGATADFLVRFTGAHDAKPLLTTLVVALAAAEMVVGGWLVARPRSIPTILVVTFLLSSFTVVLLGAHAAGITTSCGCVKVPGGSGILDMSPFTAAVRNVAFLLVLAGHVVAYAMTHPLRLTEPQRV